MKLNEAVAELQAYNGRPLSIMEVCGTHTAAILRSGIRSLLPPSIKLVSGPGCPVCVTSAAAIDTLIELSKSCCVLCFGDMFRVPGSKSSLAEAKALGGQVRLIYSPLEALKLAKESPEMAFVVAAVGFETTAPVYALLLEKIIAEGVSNIKLVVALKHIIPAVSGILSSENSIDGLICPGHVGAILGSEPFEELSKRFFRPFVMAGFEAAHVVAAIYNVVKQASNSQAKYVNLYPEVVSQNGNLKAKALLEKYFELKDTTWRGLGTIPLSGFVVKNASQYVITYEDFDEPSACACGQVLQGRCTPEECGLYGGECTPAHPVGPCMVSPEGACGLFYSSGGHL